MLEHNDNLSNNINYQYMKLEETKVTPSIEQVRKVIASVKEKGRLFLLIKS